MKNRHRYVTVLAIGGILISLGCPAEARASDGEEYITISVDAVDDNTNLRYALDSDADAAFTDSNEFTVPVGSSHTIYVKDAAGNITSQRYEPEESHVTGYYDDKTVYEERKTEEETYEEEEQRINIDLELGRKEPEEETISEEAEGTGNPGTASVLTRTKTDGTVDAEKVFYTFTTKEGEELYLVVDQGRGADQVYLLDTVSLKDLKVLADEQESSSDGADDGKEDNLLSILSAEGQDNEPEEAQESPREKKSFGNGLFILFLALFGGGAYYYMKIYRNKKDEAMDAMDAMDMDEFEAEDDEEEIEFDYDEAEKERYLEALINEDEDSGELYDLSPDEYATSHTMDMDSDSDIGDEENDDDDDSDSFDGMEIEF